MEFVIETCSVFQPHHVVDQLPRVRTGKDP